MEPAHSLFGRERYPLDAFFRPRSVAVIGATEAPGSVGRTALWNLISSPFGGTVYPVNPKRGSVLGVRAYPTIADVPEPVELALLATPAATAPDLIGQCVKAGVRGAILLASGFREQGPKGEALERDILREAHQGSLRLVGPNSLGVMCPPSGLNATFARGMAQAGNVAFLSQSGALSTAVLDWSRQEHVGFSAFVSLGSMADVGWGDLIDYLGNDPRTRSILIYMESIGDAGAFLSAAREVALSKPVIVIKSGRTAEGARAAAAHTGAVPGDDDVFDAALRRCGVVRVNQISDLFYMAEALGKQPRPRGKRLTLVTNAGGPAVLATDALISGGGTLAPLAEETRQALREALPAESHAANPVDVMGDATAERYSRVMAAVAKDNTTDGFLVVLAPQAMTDPLATAEQVRAFAKTTGKPVLASWMGGETVASAIQILQSGDIPTFPYPDTAVRMFLYMASYSDNLKAIYETPMADEEVPGKVIDPGDGRSLVQAYDLAPAEGIRVGSFLDAQFGPVVYIENETGQRSLGLPPLTTTLARLMIDRLQLSADVDRTEAEWLLVRLARMVSEQPRIRASRFLVAGAEVQLHDPALPAEALPKPAIRPYPVEYAGMWRMKNGDQVLIRPIRPEDEPLIAQFHQTLSERTVYFRYLSTLKLSTRIAHERLIRICFIDYARQMALVVEHRDPEKGEPSIIAVGRLHKDMQAFARGIREAEFSLVVSDAYQGQGLGKELLLRIIEVARKENVDTVFGEISAENMAMQAICRSMGFQIRRDYEDTTVVARLKVR